MKDIKLLILFFLVFLGNEKMCFSQHNVGDTLQFWSVTYIDWPPLFGTPQRSINAICRKAGIHCYIFVEDSVNSLNQIVMDSLVHNFDYHFYDSLTKKYGPAPNVFDNDSNIFILVTKGVGGSGYFDPGQQMSDSLVYAKWNRHSSQREILYINSNNFNAGVSTIAHEFGHLLHWNQDHSPEPIINPVKYWEDAWVDEGFSTFAEIYLLSNINQHNLIGYNFCINNPDIPLIYFSDYNQARLFMLFMYEHYGKWNYISSLISNQLNGIKGVQSTLNNLGYSESFDDVFEQWVVANYIDDSLYENGKYSYTYYNFYPCFVSANYSPYTSGIVNSTVKPYGSDYIEFTSNIATPIHINFNGQLNSKFRVAIILKDTITNHIDSVINIPLDASNHATFATNYFGVNFNKIIMTVMNVDSTIHENDPPATYSYSASQFSVIQNNQSNCKISVFPNPIKDKLYINSSNNLNTKIEIIDIQGRVCFNSFFKNSIELNVNEFTKGIYFLKIINFDDIHFVKIIKE